jgi:hypothetical protein
MVARTPRTHRGRRGIILILVLAMLALMALIGVTFAMLGGQARINARNFAERLNLPDAAVLMDFALDQLVNDTSNPMSAIRGHSLKRDMYGNDAVNNGFLAGLPDGTPLMLLAARVCPPPRVLRTRPMMISTRSTSIRRSHPARPSSAIPMIRRVRSAFPRSGFAGSSPRSIPRAMAAC